MNLPSEEIRDKYIILYAHITSYPFLSSSSRKQWEDIEYISRGVIHREYLVYGDILSEYSHERITQSK